MNTTLEFLTGLSFKTIMTVINSLNHNWIPLSLAILTATIMKVYLDTEKLKKALLQKSKVSILASVTIGALTPLCACGTMAVIIGMLTTTLPWGPIMAFLTSSPLMSPDSFIMLAGVINSDFAIALTIASIAIGLGSGYITHYIEIKTDFLKNQTKLSEESQTQACTCSETLYSSIQVCGCSSPSKEAENKNQLTELCCLSSGSRTPKIACCAEAIGDSIIQPAINSVPEQIFSKNYRTRRLFDFWRKIRWSELFSVFINVGLKQILLYFSLFVAVGFLINSFIPTTLIVALFSSRNVLAVPLAALIGLPLYINGESAIPLIKSLMEGGAGGGSMMAFMITGQGTSAWVIAGIAAFMKRKVMILYIFFILFGGILMGYLYDLYLLVTFPS